MNVENIGFISPSINFEQLLNHGTSASQQTNFMDLLDQQISVLNNDLEVSDTKLRQLATGESTNLHDIMLSLEKAKLSMELVLQVRNKALEAYQELMRTQL